MKNPRVHIIHAYNIRPEVHVEASVYAPNDYIYVLPNREDTFLQVAKTYAQFERERNEWMHKYNNLLNGLNYWKNKALEKE